MDGEQGLAVRPDVAERHPGAGASPGREGLRRVIGKGSFPPRR